MLEKNLSQLAKYTAAKCAATLINQRGNEIADEIAKGGGHSFSTGISQEIRKETKTLVELLNKRADKAKQGKSSRNEK